MGERDMSWLKLVVVGLLGASLTHISAALQDADVTRRSGEPRVWFASVFLTLNRHLLLST